MNKIRATLARTGIQKYLIDGEWRNVLRDEVTVSSANTSRLPITLDHPPLFISDNYESEYVVGQVEDLKYRDGLLFGWLKIEDISAQNKIRQTHKYISLGYRAKLVKISGEWIDERGIHGHIGEAYPYEYKQENIQLDHAALVARPRAGAIASLQIDSAQTENEQTHFLADSFNLEVPQTFYDSNDWEFEPTMSKSFIFNDEVLTIEGDNSSSILDALNSQKEQIKALVDSLSTKSEECESTTGQLEASKVKVAELEDSINELTSALAESKQARMDDSEIVNRIEIWEEVKPTFLKDNSDFKPDYSKSVTEVKKSYLELKAPHLADKLKEASDSFIDGLWEGLQPSNQPQSSDKLQDALEASETIFDAPKTIKRNAPLPGLN